MTSESLVNEVFCPYAIDDSMEAIKVLYNYEIISKLENELKEVDIAHARAVLKKKSIVKEDNKKFKLYNHSFYSDTAISLIEWYVKALTPERDKINKILEEKLVKFFKSYEWETWGLKYIEAESDYEASLAQYTPKKKKSK